MGIFTLTVSMLMLLLMLATPIALLAIYKKKQKRIGFFIINFYSLSVLAALSLLFAWWGQTSYDLRLWSLGFDFTAVNAESMFFDVKAEDIEEAERLYLGRMGIGWPVKAMFLFALTVPYPTVILICNRIICRIRLWKNQNT